MKFAGVATVLLGMGVFIACQTAEPPRPLTEVEKAQQALVDLNATQAEVTQELLEKRNELLGLPRDSPPTREISRQLAILNKRATDLASELFRAELHLEKVIAEEKEKIRLAALDENASASPVYVNGSLRLYPFTIEADETSGTRSVVGEVGNSSTNAVTDVKVVFTLYDSTDESVGTVSDFVARIDGESRWAFKALILDDNATRAERLDLNGTMAPAAGIPALPGGNAVPVTTPEPVPAPPGAP